MHSVRVTNGGPAASAQGRIPGLSGRTASRAFGYREDTMDTFTYDLRVQDCTRQQLAGYARTLAGPGAVSVRPIDPQGGVTSHSYRLVVRPGAGGTDAATTIARLAWMLNATGRFVSVRQQV